jgi:hypothetical protein
MGPARVIGCGPAYVRREGSEGGARGHGGATLGPRGNVKPLASTSSCLSHLAVLSSLLSSWNRPSAQRAAGRRESRDRGVRVSPPPPQGPGHRPGPLLCPTAATEPSVHAGYTPACACSRSRRSARPCQLGIQALQLLGAVECETGVQRVRDLRVKLRPWRNHPAVADLTEQLLLVS